MPKINKSVYIDLEDYLKIEKRAERKNASINATLVFLIKEGIKSIEAKEGKQP